MPYFKESRYFLNISVQLSLSNKKKENFLFFLASFEVERGKTQHIKTKCLKYQVWKPACANSTQATVQLMPLSAKK